jgi:DNA adenine methylase
LSSSEAVTQRAARRRTRLRKNDLVQPFLKWAGGKRQLLSELRKYIPREYNLYFEPFVGAGAVLFDKQPPAALINDANKELINCYRVVKSNPEKLISLCHEHRRQNSREYFYQLRELDRKADFINLAPEERAARIIYLNKTCYNGLFRVNSQGQFNVPYGDYKDPQIVDDAIIRAVSRYLNDAQIDPTAEDFEKAVSGADADDFVYFDPPYDPLSDTASFTGYNLTSFDRQHQQQLKRVCDELTERGCKVLVSNSATDFIRDLYKDKRRYTIVEVAAARNINSVPTGRGKISELLIFNNYDVNQVKE